MSKIFEPGQVVKVKNPGSMFDGTVGIVVTSYTNDLGDWVRVDFGQPRDVPCRPSELHVIVAPTSKQLEFPKS